ncbi:hypothetical protein I4F81_000263 [Pyropia yezoensis]|uniref:Uncharacterized protein n=1 Tax=Pyropia yezoensis TaxID=2788 RepID=A0ACC3BIN9_PYRYE|nr:hypothetical protein I4F81_000263 [Neopyropia yezoensis]
MDVEDNGREATPSLSYHDALLDFGDLDGRDDSTSVPVPPLTQPQPGGVDEPEPDGMSSSCLGGDDGAV